MLWTCYNDDFNTSELSQMFNCLSVQIVLEIPKYRSNSILLSTELINKIKRLTNVVAQILLSISNNLRPRPHTHIVTPR